MMDSTERRRSGVSRFFIWPGRRTQEPEKSNHGSATQTSPQAESSLHPNTALLLSRTTGGESSSTSGSFSYFEEIEREKSSPSALNIIPSLHAPSESISVSSNENQLLREVFHDLCLKSDFTGQVTRTSDHPIASSSFNDTYPGLWSAGVKVSLRIARAAANESERELRFFKELSVWRQMRHPNVVIFYGIASISDRVYAVGQWAENGSAVVYLQDNPDADRLQMLTEVTTGLEYLHSCRIVHGYIQGSNILISEMGRALISEFSLARTFEEVENGVQSIPPDINHYRWCPPEMIKPKLLQKGVAYIPSSADVWSLGMLCIELLTDEQPFSHLPRDTDAMFEIADGGVPPLPGALATSRGLDNKMWEVMNSCWSRSPRDRPSMTYIRMSIQRLREGYEEPRVNSVQSQEVQPTVLPTLSADFAPDPFLPSLFNGTSTIDPSIQTYHTPLPSLPNSTASSNQGGLRNESPWARCESPRSSPSLCKPERSTIPVVDLRVQSTQYSHFSGPHAVPETLSSVDTSHSRTNGSEKAKRTNAIPSIQIAAHDSVHQITNPECYYNSDGQLESGTLESLIEILLINPKETKNGSAYGQVFLATYPMFTAAENVLSILIYKFQRAMALPLEPRKKLQKSIMVAIEDWLTNSFVQLDPNNLSRIRDFCYSNINSDEIVESVRTSLGLIDQKMLTFDDYVPPSSESSLLKSTRTTSIPNASELAKALTILQGDQYSHIRPRDYISHLRHTENHRCSIDEVLLTSKVIADWVQKSILKGELEKRAGTLVFFMMTAEECRKLHNFAAVAAITTALNSAVVTRLKQTRDIIPRINKKATSLLDNFCKVIDSEDDFHAYRQALNGSKKTRIPWLEIHLDDMEAVLRASSAISIEQRTWIDFTKYIKFYTQIQEMESYDPPNLARYREAGPSAYLERELRSIRLHPPTQAFFEQKSIDLAAAEQIIFNSRLPQLDSLGFKVHQPKSHNRTVSDPVSSTSFSNTIRGSRASPQVSTMKPSYPTPPRRGTLNSQLSIPMVDVAFQSNEFGDGVFSDISYGSDARDHGPAIGQAELYQNPSSPTLQHPQIGLIPSSETSNSADQVSLAPLSPLGFSPLPVKSTNSLFSVIREHVPLLHRADNGEVGYGTLTGLIDQLFKDSQDTDRDREYRKTFLTTYLAFTTAEDILRIFSYRLHTVGPSSTSSDNYIKKILAAVKEWVDNYSSYIDASTLSQIKEICRAVKGSASIKVLVGWIISRVDQRLRSLDNRDDFDFLSSSVTSVPNVTDIGPYDLAEALLALEGKLYSCIRLSDYMAYIKHLPGGKSISQATAISAMIAQWVQSSVSQSDSTETQRKSFHFFVSTAEECLRLCNFASMSAIVTVLNNPALNHLATVARYERSLQEMKDLLSPDNNFQAYRRALVTSKAACVPWLAVHISDLKDVFHRGFILQTDDRPMIDFVRCTELYSVLRELADYQVPSTDMNSEKGPFAFLKNELLHTSKRLTK